MTVLWGHHIRPFVGERVAGDAAVMRELGDGSLFAIIDGLGHGPEAHSAALVAVSYIESRGGRDLRATMARLHQALRGTRGAAIGLCFIEHESGSLSYCGIGNTVIRVVDEEANMFFSRDGVVGQRIHEPRVQTAHLRPGATVVLHTDGISQRCDMASMVRATRASPGALARRIVERFGKASDDVGCIAIQYIP